MKYFNSKEVLLDVISDCQKNFLNNFNTSFVYFSKSIRADNFLYVLFRTFTNQRIRDRVFRLIGFFKNLKSKEYDFKYVDNNEYEYLKCYSLDYLNYVFKYNPLLNLSYFSLRDKKEILSFIKKYFYFVFLGKIPKSLFTDEELFFEKKRIEEQDKIRIVSGHFEYRGFKTCFPAIINLVDFSCYKVSNRRIKIALDLGGFIGDTAYAIYRTLSPDKIFVFEPNPENMSILRQNIKLNSLDKFVVPVEMAVGLKEGRFSFKMAGGASGLLGSNVLSSNDSVINVKVTSIDNFVKKNKINKVDFIKMDIEGAEFDALKGAVNTLRRDKPDLLIAIYHKGEHFFEIPGWLKKQVPEYNLRFVAMNGASPIMERYIAASVRKI